MTTDDQGMLPIGALVLDPNNPRHHTQENLEMIEQSMRDIGAARSVVIDEENNLVVGSGAAQGAMAAGITKVQVVEVDGDTLVAVRRRGLTPEQKQKLKLYDNRAGQLAEWDGDVLAQMAAQGDIDLSEFFDPQSLDDLLAAIESDETILPPEPSGAFFKHNPYADNPFALDSEGNLRNPEAADAATAQGPGFDPDGDRPPQPNQAKNQMDAGLKVVSFYLTVPQHAKFYAAAQAVAQAWGLQNVTDVMYQGMLRLAESLKPTQSSEESHDAETSDQTS